MKRKRTDSLREREVEELQHAVKRFKSNSSTDATMKRGVDDRSVYSIVFVLLEIRSGEKIIWKNLIPNSPDATRHLLFCFAKETASFIQEKFEHLKNEIFLLKNIEFKLGESTFVVKSSLSTIYTTMNDGKTLNAVVSNMLKKKFHLSPAMYALQILRSLI
ncbi:uncharacterized protein LOC124819045 [Hydra vulgaris]|uniref:uncharacterized protein LOC124819045 n=1 Tax=Hydra vulgaris TaxID=6087 RepID=UPI0032EA5F4F